MAKKPVKRELPEPDVEFRSADDRGEFTVKQIIGMACNPIYAGLGPFPKAVSDEVWVAGVAELIEEIGVEQFLVNLLFVLRKTFEEYPDWNRILTGDGGKWSD